MNCEEVQKAMLGSTMEGDPEAERAVQDHIDQCPVYLAWWDAEEQIMDQQFIASIQDRFQLNHLPPLTLQEADGLFKLMMTPVFVPGDDFDSQEKRNRAKAALLAEITRLSGRPMFSIKIDSAVYVSEGVKRRPRNSKEKP